MSLGGIVGYLGVRGMAMLGLGGAGWTYWQSHKARDLDLQDGKKDGTYLADSMEGFVANTLVPATKDAVMGVTHLTGGLASAAMGVGTSPAVTHALKTGTGVVTTGLEYAAANAPGAAEKALDATKAAAGTAGNAAAAAAGFTWETALNFAENLLPKSAGGWMKTAAAAGALALGGKWIADKGWLGEIAKKAADSIFNIPMSLLSSVLGPVGGVLGTVAAIGAALLIIPLVLFPEARANAWSTVKNFFPSKGDKSPEHGHEPHQQQAKPQAAPAPAAQPQQNPVTVVDVNGVQLGGVQGGTTAISVSKPSGGAATPTTNIGRIQPATAGVAGGK